jgi:hypothetical protein
MAVHPHCLQTIMAHVGVPKERVMVVRAGVFLDGDEAIVFAAEPLWSFPSGDLLKGF